jgi:hypothetical protein
MMKNQELANHLRLARFFVVCNSVFGFSFWLLLNVFVYASIFSGCFLGFVFGLGSGLGFVWLWLWKRFFNMVVAPKPTGCGKEPHGCSNENQRSKKDTQNSYKFNLYLANSQQMIDKGSSLFMGE